MCTRRGRTVLAFTDTYLPTMNGVSYTVANWAEHWNRRWGEMDIVYPDAPAYDPAVGEHPVESLPLPLYDDFRLAIPRIPSSVRSRCRNGSDLVLPHSERSPSNSTGASNTGNDSTDRGTPDSRPKGSTASEYCRSDVSDRRLSSLKRTQERDGAVDVVHAHTPCSMGLAAQAYATRYSLPLVASYHTPLGEYARYVGSGRRITKTVGRLARAYERWFYDDADLVVVPTETVRRQLESRFATTTRLAVVSNGVDLDRFSPVDPDRFRRRHRLDDSDPIIGYTGRHGFEKDLDSLLEATTNVTLSTPTVVVGGDGPARSDLERRANECDVDARFLGVLDRNELPSLYSALDVFVFPSPVETQGIVALESIACGTPVVAVDTGALSETVEDDETGYHFDRGDSDGLARAIERAYDNRNRLESRCLERRDELCVESSLERLDQLYEELEVGMRA